jgi:hypothetical protein
VQVSAAVGADAAFGVAAVHSVRVVAASESDSVSAVSVANVSVLAATEVDAVSAVSPSHVAHIVTATETDSSIGVPAAHSVLVRAATEQDSTFVVKLPFVTAVFTSEVDTALAAHAAHSVSVVSTPSDNEHAQPMSVVRGVSVGVPGYVETAQVVGVIHNHVVAVGVAHDVEVAENIPVSNSHIVVVGTAAETETVGVVLQTHSHTIPVAAAYSGIVSGFVYPSSTTFPSSTLYGGSTVAGADRAFPVIPARKSAAPPLMDVTITAIAPWSYPLQPAPLLTVEFDTFIPSARISYGDELSLQPVGFEVRVLAAPTYSTVLAIIADWSELVFGPALSAEGNGSVTMSLDSPFWLTTLPGGLAATALLDDEHLWEVWENGQCRFQFLGMTVQEEILEASGGHAVSVSGPGTAEVLKWAQIFPPAFPAMTGDLGLNWQFNMLGTPSTSSMDCWLQLLQAAQGRGTIPFVDPQFTTTTDSNGAPWSDIGIAGPWLPVLGIDLLAALNTATGQDTSTGQTGTSGQDSTASVTLVADWKMLPQFKLLAAPVLGTHKEDTVIFYDNNSNVTRTRVRSRQSIANYEAVIVNSVIDYSLVTDSTSIAKWNQREMLSYNEAMTDPAQRDALATALLDGQSDEQSEWVLAVAYGVKGRMPFVDFDVGDWIGVEQYSPTGVDPLTGTPTGGTTVVESNRVVAIVIQVSADNTVSMELTLNSTLTSWQSAIQQNIARALTIANTVPPGFGTNQASYSSYSATVSPTTVSTLIGGWVETSSPSNTHVSVDSGGFPSVPGSTALTIQDSGSYAITLQAADTPGAGGDWVVRLTYNSFDSYAPATQMVLYVGSTVVATSPSVSQAIYIPRGGYLTFSVQGTASSPSGQQVVLDVLKVS